MFLIHCIIRRKVSETSQKTKEKENMKECTFAPNIGMKKEEEESAFNSEKK